MESQLKEFLDRLQPAAGSNLVSVVLYGSATTGEFRAGQSDLNILCLVNHADAKDLESLHGVSEWWIKKGNHPPLIFTREELNRSADVFAIELLDMRSNHRILYGPDFLTDLEVPLSLHRLQVERELRTNWLRLRQAIIAAPLTEKAHLALMTNSLSTFCSLFRHAVYALGEKMPGSKREAVSAAAKLTNSDASTFHKLLDLREAKLDAKSIAVEPSLHSYLAFVESITNEVDRRLESQ
jgi:predicted nucleotidyltransferase